MNQIPTVYYRKNQCGSSSVCCYPSIPDSNSIERERYPLDYSKDHAEERTMTKSYAVGSMYKVHVIMHALLVPHT